MDRCGGGEDTAWRKEPVNRGRATEFFNIHAAPTELGFGLRVRFPINMALLRSLGLGDALFLYHYTDVKNFFLS
jgi:hypothetical protein